MKESFKDRIKRKLAMCMLLIEERFTLLKEKLSGKG